MGKETGSEKNHETQTTIRTSSGFRAQGDAYYYLKKKGGRGYHQVKRLTKRAPASGISERGGLGNVLIKQKAQQEQRLMKI